MASETELHYQKRILQILDSVNSSDDYNRAVFEFSGLSDELMDRSYGRSGKTRREILAEYERAMEHDKEMKVYLIRVFERENGTSGNG